MIGTTILTETKVNKETFIKGIQQLLNIESKDVMYIENSDGWLDTKDEVVVVEYSGVTDDEIAKDMHMYDVFSDKKVNTSDLQKYIKEKLYDSNEF